MCNGDMKVAWNSCLHEFLASFLFVGLCCFVASFHGGGSHASVLTISLTFGFMITLLVYVFAHKSGAQVNSAVTLSLMIIYQWGDEDGLTIAQGLFNMIGQLGGATCGALMTYFLNGNDGSKGMGLNQIANPDFDWPTALGETLGTFFLCLCVLMTAVNKNSIARTNEDSNPTGAPLAIGIVVAICHIFLIPVDGCSINPTRSFGAAIVGAWSSASDYIEALEKVWNFLLWPHVGAALAAFFYVFQDCGCFGNQA